MRLSWPLDGLVGSSQALWDPREQCDPSSEEEKIFVWPLDPRDARCRRGLVVFNNLDNGKKQTRIALRARSSSAFEPPSVACGSRVGKRKGISRGENVIAYVALNANSDTTS